MKSNLILFVASIFVFALFIFSIPQSASAGATLGFGCCVNNGGNCNPGCGSEGDSCQRDGSGGINPCPQVLTLEDTCGGLMPTNVGCFVEGATCLQVANNTGECVPFEPPGEPDCPFGGSQNQIDEACNPDLCFDASCTEVGTCVFILDETNDASCVDLEPPLGPITIIPTMGQWGMLLAAIVLGAFAIIRIRSLKDSELS